MNATWRAVPDFGGIYEVSSTGDVRNVKTGRIRSLKTCKRGYHWLAVSNGRGGSANASVARLVCGAFNGPCPPSHEVDHINRVRDDNRSENLRWVTKAQNLRNRVNRRGSSHANAKLTEQIVRDIRSGRMEGNNRQIARALGVSRETIRDTRNGKQWKHVL